MVEKHMVSGSMFFSLSRMMALLPVPAHRHRKARLRALSEVHAMQHAISSALDSVRVQQWASQ